MPEHPRRPLCFAESLENLYSALISLGSLDALEQSEITHVKEIQDQEQQSTPTSNLVHIQLEKENSSQPKLHSFFTNFPLNQQQSYSYFAEDHSRSYQATSHHSAEDPSS